MIITNGERVMKNTKNRREKMLRIFEQILDETDDEKDLEELIEIIQDYIFKAEGADE
ncbi:hypothetical protein LS215_3004 [Sulfolobus islandicus L.S.2.15]|uniref:Uncharacterized protein n=1 Tax=Saccharolobus islandicus (strain L.S.2.15 / Lassen \|nr:hypothetical protein [Sulfolobus islandicus]ACP35457.1 hypothetical protein LS215_3004 [Sulfolobus islandicus L.S.2.15]